MANVGFKWGTQSSLSGYLNGTKTVQEGAFYLTTDTRRLFLGQSGNQLIPIAETISTVSSVANLPSTGNYAGQFYYAIQENVLCIYNTSGAENKWIQINPDTRVTSIGFSKGESGDKVVTLSLSQNNDGGDTATANLTFSGDLVSVGSNGTVTIATPNLGISYIDSEDAQSASDTLTLQLGTGKVDFVAGSNIDFTKTGDKVTISGTDQRVNSIDVIENNTENNALNPTGFSVYATMSGDGGNTSRAGIINPRIKTDSTGTGTISFSNGVADLTGKYYTKTEVDRLITNFDAVEYKSTYVITKSGSNYVFPTENVHKGDMYMISGVADGGAQIGGQNVRIGDLIIATGEENEQSGVIPANSITWELIPSGNDVVTDTTYGFEYVSDNSNGSGIVVKDENGNVISSFKVKKGNKISLTSSESAEQGVVTIAHEAITTNHNNDVSAGSGEMVVVTGLTTSDGHVTEVAKTAMKEAVYVSSVDETLSVTNNTAEIGLSIGQKYRNGGSDYGTAYTPSFKLQGSGLDVQKSGTDTVVVSLNWGTF